MTKFIYFHQRVVALILIHKSGIIVRRCAVINLFFDEGKVGCLAFHVLKLYLGIHCPCPKKHDYGYSYIFQHNDWLSV